MVKKTKQDERLDRLEAVVEEISGQVTEIGERLNDLGVGGLAGAEILDLESAGGDLPSGLATLSHVSLLRLLCHRGGDVADGGDANLSIAAQAGSAVSRAETSAATAENEAQELDNLLPIRDRSSDAEKAAGRRQARRLARAVRDALAKGHAAKHKVAGAAADARRFAAARPKIIEAEASFQLAESFVRSAEKAIRIGRINQAGSTLKDAQQKVAADIDHLKDALEAIEAV